jgi:hypothetical protein
MHRPFGITFSWCEASRRALSPGAVPVGVPGVCCHGCTCPHGVNRAQAGDLHRPMDQKGPWGSPRPSVETPGEHPYLMRVGTCTRRSRHAHVAARGSRYGTRGTGAYNITTFEIVRWPQITCILHPFYIRPTVKIQRHVHAHAHVLSLKTGRNAQRQTAVCIELHSRESCARSRGTVQKQRLQSIPMGAGS